MTTQPERTATATESPTTPAPLNPIANMNRAQLEKLIEDEEESHRERQKHLKALAKVTPSGATKAQKP